MSRFLSSWLGLLLLPVLFVACKKESDSPPTPATPTPDATTDASLFTEIGAAGYTYYAGTPGITPVLGNSAHSFERTRFNALAQGALTSGGKLPVGGTFPDGAVIVKEVYASATGPLQLYAVMKKAPTSAAAGSRYLWAEYALDGRPIISIATKGAVCINCHTAGTNRDLVRSFDLH